MRRSFLYFKRGGFSDTLIREIPKGYFPIFEMGYHNLKDGKKLNRGWIITGVIFLAMGIAFVFIPVQSDMSTVIFVKAVFPLGCLAAAYFAFYQSKHEEASLYSPEKQPDEKIFRLIAKAYENHRRENSERKPIEQELEPAGNIILNKKKYIDGINALIAETGLTRAEFEQDYYNGEVFRSLTSMLNIGREFVTYSDTNGNQYIIKCRRILRVYPYIENTEMYNMGMKAGVVQKFYIIIVTPDITYKFTLADYMDRHVIDAFRRIYPYLHYECEIYKYPYPAVSP